MLLLATADLHYALRQFDWMCAQGGDFDAVILAGDLLDMASSVDLEVQAVVVQKYLRRMAGRGLVLTTSGNHDILDHGGDERTAGWLEELSAPTLAVDYDSVLHRGALFSLASWWDGPVSKSRTEAVLAADAARGVRPWIWLHHNPPAATPVAWNGRRDVGDPALVAWIEQFRPDFVFSGHIHNAPFYPEGGWAARQGDTWIFNAGRQPGAEPTRIVVDLSARTAEWFSFEGNRKISL